MPDIRTLLDDATRRAPHADPVAAVHATVRRRARNRRVAAAAGTALAVVATGLVLTNVPGLRDTEPAKPTIPEWRAFSRSDWPNPVNDPTFDRATRLVHGHPDVFVGFESAEIVDHHGTWIFGLSAGTDPDQWADEMDAAVGQGKWRAQVCKHTAQELDRIVESLPEVHWPSGATFHEAQYDMGCVVLIGLDRAPREDQKYATQQWGDEIYVGQTAS